MHKSLALLLSLLLPVCAAAADLSDPTRPSGFSAPRAGGGESGALKLSFIRLGREPLAVINGENVRPGQSIGGRRLLSLQASSATLSGSDGTLVLKLNPTLQKSSAMTNP